MLSEIEQQLTAAVPLAPKFAVAGVFVSRTTYADATASIIQAARRHTSLIAAATSVHGLTIAATTPGFKRVLNSFELVTPDGQPVRWALNLLHAAGLTDRVYGPNLMRRVCEEAARAGLSIYLYGGRADVLARLVERLTLSLPGLRVAGSWSPPFRPLSAAEDAEDIERIRASGADIVFVGLGCPRQEQWAFDHRAQLDRPLVCVGAAFDFHAGTLRQAPAWMQARGLEWLFRLWMEPRRLWKRYTTYIPLFVLLVGRQFVTQRLTARPRRSS